jgi:hypothetical protein
MKTLKLSNEEIDKIYETKQRFSDYTDFELIIEHHSGIGYTLDMIVKQVDILGITGDFVVALVDESSW